MGTWGEVIDGTSAGPTITIDTGGEAVIHLQALWSDVEGIVIDLNDVTLSLGEVEQLQEALAQLAALTPPVIV